MRPGKLFIGFNEQRQRLVLWTPLPLMIGIATYFSLYEEPPAWIAMTPLAVLAALLIVARAKPWRIFVFIPFFILLGFFAAQCRTQQVATPLLHDEMHNAVVEGTIDEIEPVEKREKLVLSHLTIEGLEKEQTPLRVRISYRSSGLDLQVGDRVRLTANLYPLPAPIMPGSYDFARHFYFRSIGGNGFAMRPPEIVADMKASGFTEWLNNLRHAIGEDMRAAMPGVTGAVAAAMTVGEMGPIPEETKVTLRDSGLAHMLSISGLHLAIAAGFVFFTVRLFLTLYPPLAMRVPVKKIAAFLALISASAYLLLAGSPVPAQRAFIMVAFLFVAMLFDRKGITLRTLSLAASIILLLFPEAMFGASFQMSFAATLAIVTLYETHGSRLQRPTASWLGKGFRHLNSIVVTSLAATLATSSFVLYHFNRFAIFGLISNMMVIPLATFTIMPGIVIALVLMPLGWQKAGYFLLGLGTDIMIAVSRWVTDLPYSSLHLPSPTEPGLVLASFGLVWLSLVTHRLRLLGLLFVAIGLSTIALHQPVQLLVSDDARQVMAQLDDGRYTMLKGTNRSFTTQNWIRTEGQDDVVPLKESGVECSRIICTYRHAGKTVIFVRLPAEDNVLDIACAMHSDLLIAWRYVRAYRCLGPEALIGRAELESYGAHAVWLDDKGMRILHTREDGVSRRPWQPMRTQGDRGVGNDKDEL